MCFFFIDTAYKTIVSSCFQHSRIHYRMWLYWKLSFLWINFNDFWWKLSLLICILSPYYTHSQTVIFVLESGDIPGCSCKLLSGGMGIPGLCSEDFVHWCDVGKLQQPGLSWWEHFVYRILNSSFVNRL